MHILTAGLVYLLIMGVLVFVHEWGHFIVARWCGIRVDEFNVGMGPRALRIAKWGDTEYNLRWVPLGGYVKIAGMDVDQKPVMLAAEMTQNAAAQRRAAADATPPPAAHPGKVEELLSETPLLAENTPDLNETPEERRRDGIDGFYAHPTWQRALVIFAGPFMSFALGYVAFFCLFMLSGMPHPTNQVAMVKPGSVAQKMGLRAGDRIVGLNGAPVGDTLKLVDSIHHSAGRAVTLTVQRGAQSLRLTGVPVLSDSDEGKIGELGFAPHEKLVPASPRVALAETDDFTVLWFHNLGHLLQRHNLTEIRKSAGGPIYIAQVTNQAVQMGAVPVILLAAQISMSLAIFNLLPIPILDGGHLLIFFVESLRRGRQLTTDQRQNFMLAGLAVIGVLFVFIMFNDVLRAIHPSAQ